MASHGEIGDAQPDAQSKIGNESRVLFGGFGFNEFSAIGVDAVVSGSVPSNDTAWSDKSSKRLLTATLRPRPIPI